MNKVTIKRNEYDEYELPTEPGNNAIYYTDDREDADGTARAFYGDDVVIVHRRGSYE